MLTWQGPPSPHQQPHPALWLPCLSISRSVQGLGQWSWMVAAMWARCAPLDIYTQWPCPWEALLSRSLVDGPYWGAGSSVWLGEGSCSGRASVQKGIGGLGLCEAVGDSQGLLRAEPHMSCRKKRDLPTCVVKGRRAPGKSLGTWVIMLSLLPQECSTSSRPDPWPPVPSLPPNPKTPLLSAPTPSYSLFSVISSSFTQLPKRSSQPGHPQSSGTPQALGTTQFLTQASSFLALSLGTQPSPGILSPLSHLRQPPLWLQRPGPCLLLTSVPSTLVEQMSCSILT